MNKSQKILVIIITVAVLATVGYFAYSQFNALKTQEYLKTSQNLKDNATAYFDQAVAYENAGDYENAITTYQKSDGEVRKALNNNSQALASADGVYREYLDNDIKLLEKLAQLIEYKIYLNRVYNNSLNPGQETVPPSMLFPYIDNLTRDVSVLKEEENQIIKNNPDAFTFLGST
ncbi:MAG TPA: hypothetical protein VGC02_01055 [Methanobacterium sp.]